jgi:hypothetical protein
LVRLESLKSIPKEAKNMSDLNGELIEIPDQHRTSLLLIKVCLFTVFLFGVLMRIFIPIETFRHLANVLMMIAVLGRLFMYVRALNPSLFLPKQNNSSPLSLIDKKEAIVSSYDQGTRTPLERIILDK